MLEKSTSVIFFPTILCINKQIVDFFYRITPDNSQLCSPVLFSSKLSSLQYTISNLDQEQLYTLSIHARSKYDLIDPPLEKISEVEEMTFYTSGTYLTGEFYCKQEKALDVILTKFCYAQNFRLGFYRQFRPSMLTIAYTNRVEVSSLKIAKRCKICGEFE